MAIASDTRTVVGVFNSVSDAQTAVRELESTGIARDHISLVANKNAVGYDTMDESDKDKASDVVADAGIGAALGGVGGLLLSAAGAITIPVIGPILAAGPIAAALTGAGIGAATGGLIGALTESGIPEEHAKYYAEGVRRGDVLVTVRAEPGMADQVSDILDRNHAVNVDDRVTDWKDRGWSGYSNDASPYSDDELRRERDYYRGNRGTLTGHTGIDVDRERSGTTMGTTGMTGLGLGSAGATTSDRLSDSARETGREASEKIHRTEQRVSNATSITNPGHPGKGDTGDRTRDALGEAGREIKEFGRDTKDVLTGHTEKRPHDYAEDMRDAERERRRRSRIY